MKHCSLNWPRRSTMEILQNGQRGCRQNTGNDFWATKYSTGLQHSLGFKARLANRVLDSPSNQRSSAVHLIRFAAFRCGEGRFCGFCVLSRLIRFRVVRVFRGSKHLTPSLSASVYFLPDNPHPVCYHPAPVPTGERAARRGCVVGVVCGLTLRLCDLALNSARFSSFETFLRCC
jgi:hypothetical protein